MAEVVATPFQLTKYAHKGYALLYHPLHCWGEWVSCVKIKIVIIIVVETRDSWGARDHLFQLSRWLCSEGTVPLPWEQSPPITLNVYLFIYLIVLYFIITWNYYLGRQWSGWDRHTRAMWIYGCTTIFLVGTGGQREGGRGEHTHWSSGHPIF